MPTTAIRNAATVVALRDHKPGDPAILMGQRGAGAAFMPNKFVFPGGAVDPGDATVPLAKPIADPCGQRLLDGADADLFVGLQTAAIRELWEEAGLAIGTPGDWTGPVPEDWQDYAQTGLRPSGHAFRYVFRAITPPGRPRRFDARFFMVNASHLHGDLDDFSRASDELSHLHWVPLSEASALDLPFITSVVLHVVADLIGHDGPPARVPFFQGSDEEELRARMARGDFTHLPPG